MYLTIFRYRLEILDSDLNVQVPTRVSVWNGNTLLEKRKRPIHWRVEKVLRSRLSRSLICVFLDVEAGTCFREDGSIMYKGGWSRGRRHGLGIEYLLPNSDSVHDQGTITMGQKSIVDRMKEVADKDEVSSSFTISSFVSRWTSLIVQVERSCWTSLIVQVDRACG